MEKTEVWYSVNNGGDGSAYPIFFLTASEAEGDQEDMEEGWGEPCTGCVETYIGSNVHKEAVQSSKEYAAKQKAKAAGVEDWQWDYEDYLDDSQGS